MHTIQVSPTNSSIGYYSGNSSPSKNSNHKSKLLTQYKDLFEGIGHQIFVKIILPIQKSKNYNSNSFSLQCDLVSTRAKQIVGVITLLYTLAISILIFGSISIYMFSQENNNLLQKVTYLALPFMTVFTTCLLLCCCYVNKRKICLSKAKFPATAHSKLASSISSNSNSSGNENFNYSYHNHVKDFNEKYYPHLNQSPYNNPGSTTSSHSSNSYSSYERTFDEHQYKLSLPTKSFKPNLIQPPMWEAPDYTDMEDAPIDYSIVTKRQDELKRQMEFLKYKD